MLRRLQKLSSIHDISDFCHYLLHYTGIIRIFTARKRSLRRLCFYTCLSFILFTGGACMVAWGGMHGCSGGVGRGCCGGHAWLLQGGMCGCSRGGMRGCLGGAWFLWGGVHGCSWGRAWLLRGHAWDTTRYADTVNERAVRILLECILVICCYGVCLMKVISSRFIIFHIT